MKNLHGLALTAMPYQRQIALDVLRNVPLEYLSMNEFTAYPQACEVALRFPELKKLAINWAPATDVPLKVDQTSPACRKRRALFCGPVCRKYHQAIPCVNDTAGRVVFTN